LTAEQEAALARLIEGATEAETATAAGVPVANLRDWLSSDPLFVAERNRRRQDAWDNHADRLRGLLPKALDVLAGALESEDPRTQHAAALVILRACGLAGGRDLTPSGPTSITGVAVGWSLRDVM
jgi:hypothetical protein